MPSAGDIPAPTPEALTEYFNQRKILFRAPEFRKIEVLTLIPSEQASWIEVSDDDIKRAYEDHRESFGTPEKRQIQQIVFPSVEAARADAERIAAGTSFADIAKERGFADKDIELGTLTKSSMIDRAMADAAFALKEGETSAPVQGRFGVALVHVVKIEPEVIRPLSEVAPEIKKSIATERAKAQILSVYDKIEDVRSEGHTLAEAATTLKLAARSVELDRSGHDPAGQIVKDLPDAQRLLATAFSTDVGVDADPLQGRGRLRLVRGRGHHAGARSHPRRGEGQGRGELARGRDRDPPEGQGGADARQAQGRGDARRSGGRRGAKVETITGLKRGAAAPPLSAAAADKLFLTPKDGSRARTPSSRAIRWYFASPTSWCPRPT